MESDDSEVEREEATRRGGIRRRRGWRGMGALAAEAREWGEGGRGERKREGGERERERERRQSEEENRGVGDRLSPVVLRLGRRRTSSLGRPTRAYVEQG